MSIVVSMKEPDGTLRASVEGRRSGAVATDETDAGIAEAVNAAMEDAVRAAGFATQDPDAEAARLEAMHRDALARHRRRIADTKAALKAEKAALARQRADEDARHRAECERLATALADLDAKADADIAADRRIAASCRAALEALEAG